MKDRITGSDKAAGRSGKAGGGMGDRQADGIKGGGKRSTHISDKKGSSGGLTSD